MSGRAPAVRAPKARSCYICGRQYMLHSFAIHEAQCREMFEKWENQKPPKERRRCPDDPMRGYDPNMSMKDLDKLNAASQQTWSEQALVRCQNCNRTFLPEKLKIHHRSCTSTNPAKRVEDAVSSSRYVQASANVQGASSRFEQSGADYDGGESEYINVNSGNMMQCKNCGRKFNAVSYSKHAKVCAKVFTKSRKVFNSAKQRMQGTDLEEYNRHAAKKGPSTQRRASRSGDTSTAPSSSTTRDSMSGKASGGPAPKQTVPKWKLDSMKFRAAMKEARLVSKAEKESKATGVPLHLLLPAKPSRSSMSGYGDTGYGGGGGGGGGYDDSSDGLRCPTCGRTFSQKAGERHIPQCKNIINKPKSLAKGSGAPSYSTSSPEGKISSSGGGRGGTFGSTARTLGTSVASAGARQVERLDFDTGPAEVSGRAFGGGGGGGGGGVRSGGYGGIASTGGPVGRGSISSRPGSAGMSRGSGVGGGAGLGSARAGGGASAAGDRFAQSAVVVSSNVPPRGGSGGPVGRFGSTSGAAGATSSSGRPSPRVSDARAARGSFSGGIGSLGGGGVSSGAGAAGTYRISQSNATSSNNPILGYRF